MYKCPIEFPAGYYWYGGKQKGHGRPPKWVNEFFSSPDSSQECSTEPGDASMPASASRGDNESVSGGETGMPD